MNPIRNPFSRDEYPALTDAINGVVNGQPREVEEAVTPAQRKVFNAERERMMTALNNPNKKLSPTEREAVLARGQRNAAAEVRKDAVSPTGVKSPVHAQAKAYHEYARKESKKMDAIAKSKSVKEDIQTPAREREMLGKMKRAEARTDAEGKRYMRATGSAFATSKTKTEREKKIGKASKRYNTALSAQDKTYATQRKEEMSRRLYGKGGKLVKRAVKESQELSERIIDEVDFFQASKNWVKGKGFKTNREVSYDRVEKNYQAMKKRQEAEAKKNK